MKTIIALTLLLASCGGDHDSPKPRPTPIPVNGWQIGPIIDGKNYSINMPLQPSKDSEGWYLDFGPDSEPHYVTFQHGPLNGKSLIRGHFKIEGEGYIFGKACPSNPSSITLYFQKRGDDWSTYGNRWWATFATKMPIEVGQEFEIVAPLDGPWTSVMTKTHDNAPMDFAESVRDADRIGFTFGDCESYGHGARATGPVRVYFDVKAE